MTNADLVGLLCSASPALRQARRMHVRDFGKLVPHVFMRDVLARVGHCLEPGSDRVARMDEVQGILEILERGLAEGERATHDVIALSFVNDAEIAAFYDRLLPLLGPRLQHEVRGK
jgi:hypothetical protein